MFNGKEQWLVITKFNINKVLLEVYYLHEVC